MIVGSRAGHGHGGAAEVSSLTVVTGCRELLVPIAVPRPMLEELFRHLEPDAAIPEDGWARGTSTTPYHGFLYDDAHGLDARVELYLEYIEDTTGPGGHPVVVLPFEGLIDDREVGDFRVRHFEEHAARRFGRVRAWHLVLSARTSELLRALAESAGPEGPVLDVEQLAGRGAAFDAMRFNYNHAVLAIAERAIASTTIFEHRGGRAEALALQLAASEMRLDVDLPVERVRAELEPGGELWSLLTRPVPGGLAPAPIAARGALGPRSPAR